MHLSRNYNQLRRYRCLRRAHRQRDKVYFPFSVAEALELEEFDEVEAILIKNDRADPPWKALRARRLEES